MAYYDSFYNKTLMVPVNTTSVTCDNMECKNNMTCDGTFICANMTINSYNVANATIGNANINNLVLPSLTQNNALTRVLVEDPLDSSIHYSTNVVYPVTLPTTNNTLSQFTGTAGQIESSTISVTGGNQLSNVQTIVGNDPAAILRMSNIQTSGIAEKTLNNGVFVSSTLNYTGANQTTDQTINQVIVRDPINVNSLLYRTDFVDLLSPQDMLEKHMNAEFGGGSYFYSNSGANRKLKFDLLSSTNNTSTTLRAAQTEDRTITLPNITGTLATLAGFEDLTNKTITTDTNSVIITSGTIPAPTNINLLVDQDVRQGSNPQFATLNLGPIPTIQDVTISKTGPGASLLNIEGGGVVTIKDGVYDIVGTNLTQTLNNKTLTLPTITSINNGGIVSIPFGTDTLVNLSGTQTLSAKTIASLTATGTSQSLLSGKQLTTYVTLTTTNNTPTNILTLSMIQNQTLTLELDLSAFCTVGGELDKIRGFSVVYLIKRTSLGVMASYTISSSIAGDGGFGVGLSILLNPAGFSLQATGLTGNTINWGGNYCINYR